MASPKSAKNDPNAQHDRRSRIAELRRAEKSRERRVRVIAITVGLVAVAGLIGFGTYIVSNRSDGAASDSKADGGTAAGPIKGEKDWNAKKLTRNHVTTPVSYPMKPPVGGDHNPVWMNCDGNVYKQAIPDMNAVHSLEHGSVWVTYTDKAAASDVAELSAKVAKTPYSLMSPYPHQAGAIMLSAWGKQLTVGSADDPRVNQFFTKYVQGPQTPEPGAACTGGQDGS